MLTSLNYSYITELHLFSPVLGDLLVQAPLELMGNTFPKLFECIAYSVRSAFPFGITQAWQGELWGLISYRVGKWHQYCLFTWAVTSGICWPESLVLMCLSSLQPPDRWPLLTRETLKRHSVPRAELPAFELHYLAIMLTAHSHLRYWFGTCATF